MVRVSNRNSAGSGFVIGGVIGAVGGGGGDGSGAGGYGGYYTVSYSRYGWVAGGPSHGLVRCVVGGDGSGQRQRLAANGHCSFGLREGDARDVDGGGILIAIHINLFYTFRRVCQNGGTIYLRCLILFCGFYYKGSFAVCCCTILIVIEYAFGDGVSFGRGDSCRPTVSPPSPVSEVC